MEPAAHSSPPQNQPFAQHGEDQVGPSPQPRLGAAAMHHQRVSGKGHERKAQVKTGNVLGKDQQDVA